MASLWPSFFLGRCSSSNQIGLLHILPTFIPLFAISPAVLFALARGWDGGLLLVSMALFCVGHFHPHLLDLGQPTIFPFILFQLYFVMGCVLGKLTRQRDAPASAAPAEVGLGVVGVVGHEYAARPSGRSCHPTSYRRIR